MSSVVLPWTGALQRRLIRSGAAAKAVAAFDADPQGERYAGFLAEMADKAGVVCERLRPPDGWNDWNQVLTRRADA